MATVVYLITIWRLNSRFLLWRATIWRIVLFSFSFAVCISLHRANPWGHLTKLRNIMVRREAHLQGEVLHDDDAVFQVHNSLWWSSCRCKKRWGWNAVWFVCKRSYPKIKYEKRPYNLSFVYSEEVTARGFLLTISFVDPLLPNMPPGSPVLFALE